MEEIASGCQDAVNGIPSRRPIIEMTIPSVLDKTISPPGMQNFLRDSFQKKKKMKRKKRKNYYSVFFLWEN